LLNVYQVVVPAQFVFFNLSAILGSAILYGDFKEASFHQLVTFFYGCAATFGGVYLIAMSSDPPEDEPTTSDLESTTVPSTPEVRLGTIGRRTRHLATLDGTRPSPSLRRKPSTSSLVGFSPAQVGTLPLNMRRVLTTLITASAYCALTRGRRRRPLKFRHSKVDHELAKR